MSFPRTHKHFSEKKVFLQETFLDVVDATPRKTSIKATDITDTFRDSFSDTNVFLSHEEESPFRVGCRCHVGSFDRDSSGSTNELDVMSTKVGASDPHILQSKS